VSRSQECTEKMLKFVFGFAALVALSAALPSLRETCADCTADVAKLNE